jgi:hypothetical protein
MIMGFRASNRTAFVTFGRFATVVLAVVLLPAVSAAVVPYDIVYVRQPRFGSNNNTTWPEVAHPASIDAGADLMLRHSDGTEELLVPGGVGAVTDPFVSFDGEWVYYSYFPDMRPEAINNQRGLPRRGADIYRMHLSSRRVEQLTFGQFTPNTGAGNFDESNPLNPPAGRDYLGYGILNLGPAPVAGGKIAFSSNRNGFVPPRGLTNPTLQLFVMDEDGSNVSQIAPMNIGSALHPTPLRDGRLMFSTLETQGLRDDRVWGIWSIYPDGRRWAPVVSAFREGQAFHFMTQLSNEDLVVVDYYNLNNNGFGALYRMPVRPPQGTPAFHSAFVDKNPAIQQTVGQGFLYPFQMPFTPRGLRSIVPFTHGNDEAAPVGSNGVRVGKFTHPSAAPNDDLLVVWTPGPANDLNRPTTIPYYDAGLYLIRGGGPITGPNDLVPIKNDPNYNEAWPRAVVPYRSVHGVDEPVRLPWLPNDGTVHAALPPGSPHGLVGTSSFYKRESFPGFVVPWSDTFDGLDAFNTSENGQSSNWVVQGADAGKYDDGDIWAVRIVAMEPSTHRSYGPNGGPSGGQLFYSHAMERLRILGEIPLRKRDAAGHPILDPEGHPDTSFLAKVPADTPFTFQTLDRNGMVLNMAQTWHQVRPGEVRNDCGGCHAHSQQPLHFEDTHAARAEYEIFDLTRATPLLTKDSAGNPALRVLDEPIVNAEFLRDIRPLLQRSCVPCHTRNNANPPGNLVLDDYTLYDGLPGDYARLADDQGARWGNPPLVQVGGPVWRQTNASRYVRMFQSRRSLLTWKIFGRRLDGWSNADHPTESVAGDPSTLPSGANANQADLDYTGAMMPPPGSGVPSLTEDEKLLVARWIDLGAPIDYAQTAYGWFLDDLRPTLEVSLPRPGANPLPLDRFRIGVADAHSGVNLASLSVTADLALEGRAAGAELADLMQPEGDGIYTIVLSAPIPPVSGAHLHVRVEDHQGNVTRVSRKFSVGEAGPSLTPSPTPTATITALPSNTRTATHTRTPSLSRTPTQTATPTGTKTASATSTLVPPAATATATRTPAQGAGLEDPNQVVTPAAVRLPPVGVPIIDPVFGTTLRRVSDQSDHDGFETQIYSQLQAFSADNRYLLLTGSDGYGVRRTADLGPIAGLDTSGWNAPRWHPRYAHTVVHFDSNEDSVVRVQFTNVDTLVTATVFTFPAQDQRVRVNQSFDELSHDGRWLAGMVARSDGDQVIFALDLDTLAFGTRLSLSSLYAGACAPDPQWGVIEPDWIAPSPLGRHLVVQWPRDGTARCSGLESFDIRTGAFAGRAYDGHQHGDLGVQADGQTEFFMTFELYHPSGRLSIGVRTLPGSAIVSDPEYVQLLDWGSAEHISCRGPNGVCVVTAGTDTGNGWGPFEGEVFLQFTDGRVRRLAHHRSSSCGYWVQPRATMSRDGRYVVFASDWGRAVGCGDRGLGQGDPYVIDLGFDEPGGSEATATPTITQTALRSATRTATATSTRRPTRTRTPTWTRRPSRTATPTVTASNTRRPSRTRTPTVTRVPTATSTATRTRRPSRTPTLR